MEETKRLKLREELLSRISVAGGDVNLINEIIRGFSSELRDKGLSYEERIEVLSVEPGEGENPEKRRKIATLLKLRKMILLADKRKAKGWRDHDDRPPLEGGCFSL